MTFLLLGIIFVVFPSLMLFAFNFTTGEVTGNIFLGNMVLVLFIAVGIVLICMGIKKIVRDRKTEKHGELCYCQVTALKFNGTIINGVEQYDAYVRVYVESAGLFIPAQETVGADIDTYREKSFHVVKYYNDDINFQYPVESFEDLPVHIQQVFDNGNIIPDYF